MNALVILIAVFAAHQLLAAGAEVTSALTRAHAHNDYEHPRPLLDALEQGFCSVEADIHLVNGQLLVAHDRNKVQPERTLQRLYLEPLRERAREHGGRIYPGGPSVILLIDFKTEADATYQVLRDVLSGYTDILTCYSPDATETNAVTVIISGNRPRRTMTDERIRYAALDGRPEDLKGHAPPALVPLVSEDWKKLFTWRGIGMVPKAEKEQLRDFVSQAHAQERKLRFWGTPDRPEVWRVLWEANVDLINTDNLAGLREFLTGQESER